MLERYFKAAVALGLFPTERRLRHFVDGVFRGQALSGRDVLDVGGGRGLLSMYAGARGARRVMCLEPGADGSEGGILPRLEGFRERLGLTNVHIVARTIQECHLSGQSFDVIVLHNSINHLNEDACIRLIEDPSAWREYRAIAERLATVARPNAALIVCDCARANVFAWCGMRNPLAPTIAWHKHHSPRTWSRLFADVGFRHPSVRWNTPTSLGRLGTIVLGNAIAAFLTTSHFRLSMQYGSADPTNI